MTLTGEHLIGKKITHTETDTFHGYNPETGRPLPTGFFEATPQEVEEAVSLAQEAYPSYRKISRIDRAAFLDCIAEEIMNLGDALIERAHQETGLPDGRLRGERGRTCNQLKLFASLVREGSFIEARIDHGNPNREPFPKPDLRMMNIGLGPVAVFGASNFPLAFSVAGGDTASALAAGCPVVVKGHPAHPGTGEWVGRAIRMAVERCGMPEGTFSLLQGKGHEVGTHLVQHPGIKAVGFTGSLKGGRALYDLASARPEPIPVYAEMGSVNPVFILPEALSLKGDSMAQGLIDSTTLGVGQFCTNPGLVVGVEGNAWERFVRKAADITAAKQAGIMLTSGIQFGFQRGLQGMKTTPGVEVVQEGHVDDKIASQGVPTLMKTSGNTFLTHDILEEEVFGPSTLLVTCNSRSELLQIARKMRGNLTATLHGTPTEIGEYQDLVDILETKVGRILYNGFPTGVEVGHAMVHGGPYPATTDARSTSVGSSAIKRFLRPVCYQNMPSSLLPEPLHDSNPWNIWRMVDGEWRK